MSGEPLVPGDISNFLKLIVKSNWGLEVLMLMRKQRHRAWQREEISREIRGTLSLVDEVMGVFVKARLIAELAPGLFRYEPADQELDALVSRLEELKATYPFAVMREVIWAPNEKLHTFVDAFRFKKDRT